MAKPIRIFFSPLSNRFYAARAYKESPNGMVTITGDKTDVTADIKALVLNNNITFVRNEEEGQQ